MNNITKPTFKPDHTVSDFLKSHRDLSAADVITPWQIFKLIAFVSAMLIFLCYDYKIFWTTLLFAICFFYACSITYRLIMVILSCIKNPEIKVSKSEIAALNDEELPVYTILLPMYKESAIAEKLIRAMDHIDYPHHKLDIKILLEEDDQDTVNLCRTIKLPDCCEVIICPHSFPKTKPKACNHGLLKAKGEFLVIYDAEDRPDSDQLKKAVCAFKKVKEDVVCLQGKLNYYNPYENWLTRFFTLEYSCWFDLFLPGLHLMDAPIPLGGTSNHFRTDILQKVGGWDPFNVTEDCDLGIRLHRKGYRTQVLDSTTWEEANENLGNWLRQRSRWVKGYFQTHLVHDRKTLSTLRELGPFGFFSYIMTVGGLSLTLLLNPLFWLICLTYLGLWVAKIQGLELEPWKMLYFDSISDINPEFTLWSKLSWVFCGISIMLFMANFAFIIIHIIACAKRGLNRLYIMALLVPFYWVLISLAAWKGFLQLFLRPFYWEKTNHGLTKVDEEGPHKDTETQRIEK